MTSFEPRDLGSLDRDVARAHAAWSAWLRDVAREPAARADDEPLERWRPVTTQSTFETLSALTTTEAERPLRDALLRWVFALLEARVTRPLLVERAKLEGEAVARLTLAQPHLVSWREGWRGVVTSATAFERDAWMEALAQRGPLLASLEARITERRDEAARRLGFEDPSAPFGLPRAELVATAESVLARTDDLAASVLREARGKLALSIDPPRLADAFAIAVARDAPEGWPARITWRWLDTLFAPLVRGLRIAPRPLPQALGASSFARTLAIFGASFRAASPSPSLPFSQARDPQFIAEHRFADLFGALAASPSFQRRALGNVARVASNQARVLARTLLFAARVDAMRFLLARAPRGRERFEELGVRVLGAPLPRALAGAWPRARDDEDARLVARVTAPALAKELVDRFDEDWFANPRAVMHLRAIGSGPAHESVPADLGPHAAELARAFEEALG